MAKAELLKCIRGELVQRAAWVPFSGVHSGKLLGYSAKEVLTDADKLFASLLEVNKLYQPDGQPIIFDLQLEAEILGCELNWSTNSPPMVVSHPLKNDKGLLANYKLPETNDGRLPLILDVMGRMKEAIGETTALYALICGPFTLASHLRGSDIFLDMYDDPQYVKELMAFCSDFALKMSEFYLACGMDVIAYVDPLVSQISQQHFSDFLSDSYKLLFADLRKKQVLSSFFVCGDATRNIELMCQTGPDNISIDENIDIIKAKAVCDNYGISIGGNIRLTTTMLYGSQQANMKEVVDIIENCGIRSLVVAPGCDLPYDTPIENVIAASQAVLNFEETKKLISDFDSELDFNDFDVELPNYSALKRPLVELYTLNSANCAACAYMLKTVVDLHEKALIDFDYIEYKSTEKPSILRCKKLGVKNLPSLYINGKLYYSSLIPNSIELQKAITEAL